MRMNMWLCHVIHARQSSCSGVLWVGARPCPDVFGKSHEPCPAEDAVGRPKGSPFPVDILAK